MNICMNIGMNLVSVSYRYIGTWYRFNMGDFGDIGLNILLTDTNISVSVSVYRHRYIGIGRTLQPTNQADAPQ